LCEWSGCSPSESHGPPRREGGPDGDARTRVPVTSTSPLWTATSSTAKRSTDAAVAFGPPDRPPKRAPRRRGGGPSEHPPRGSPRRGVFVLWRHGSSRFGHARSGEPNRPHDEPTERCSARRIMHKSPRILHKSPREPQRHGGHRGCTEKSKEETGCAGVDGDVPLPEGLEERRR
jgi:hypothetical protein